MTLVLIVETPVTNQPLYGETAPHYLAYKRFHKTGSNIECGKNVDAAKFNAALGADNTLDELILLLPANPPLPASRLARAVESMRSTL